MQVWSDSFDDGAMIPDEFALFRSCDDPGPVEPSGNRSPHLAWSGAPEGTESFVVTCIDHTAPTSADDVNQPDREVPESLRRADFTHWLLADIPAGMTSFSEGDHCEGLTAGGKPADGARVGVHGQNDYTGWFAGDPDLGGSWNGYDGPAPPWNDSLFHEYEFIVYAVDVPSLALPPGFSRADLDAALEDRVLASASITGMYTTNARLR